MAENCQAVLNIDYQDKIDGCVDDIKVTGLQNGQPIKITVLRHAVFNKLHLLLIWTKSIDLHTVHYIHVHFMLE